MRSACLSTDCRVERVVGGRRLTGVPVGKNRQESGMLCAM